MKRTLARAVLTIVAAVVLGTSAGCWSDWKTQTTYFKGTTVPYYTPEGYGTAPAVIAMWWEYYAGGSWSQADIWSDLSNNGASDGDGGTSLTLFQSATQAYSGTNTYLAYYDNQSTCNGGKNCSSQAMADIHKAIENGEPPAVIMFSNKYAIVKNYGSSQRCQYVLSVRIGCQPSYDWVQIHIPLAGYGSNYYQTTSNFLASVGPGVTVFFRAPWAYLSMSNDDWAEFDAAATTYYGDPNPPEPTWGGGEDSPPDEDNRPMLTMAGGTATTTGRPKTQQGDFVPNPKSRSDIIADFVGGVKQTHLNNRPGLESLTLEDGKLSVKAIVKVRSVSDHPDYFILYLEDRSTHRLYAEGTVDASGMLGAVKLETADERPFAVAGAAEARAHALVEFGIDAQTDAEPIFGYGSIGLPEFNPMFLLTDASGRSIIVTPEGKAFHLTTQGKKLVPQTGEASLRGKHGETLILRELARPR